MNKIKELEQYSKVVQNKLLIAQKLYIDLIMASDATRQQVERGSWVVNDLVEELKDIFVAIKELREEEGNLILQGVLN